MRSTSRRHGLIFLSASLSLNGVLLFTPLRERVLRRVVDGPQAPAVLYPLDNFKFHYLQETNSPTVAVIGDSIIEQADLAAILGRTDVINRGIAGDRAVWMPLRAKYLLAKRPRVLLIEGGINDIMVGEKNEAVIAAKVAMIDFCESNGITPILMTTIKVGTPMSSNAKKWTRLSPLEINDRVDVLNNAIGVLSQKRHVKIIDSNKGLLDGGYLRESLTGDGIHLNGLGYNQLTNNLRAGLVGI